MPKIIKDRSKCPKCSSDTYAWVQPNKKTPSKQNNVPRNFRTLQ